MNGDDDRAMGDGRRPVEIRLQAFSFFCQGFFWHLQIFPWNLQAFPWWFRGVSKGCKGKKEKIKISNFSRDRPSGNASAWKCPSG
jgi:hypothetical protein